MFDFASLALKKIKKYQKSIELLISKLLFARLIKEIFYNLRLNVNLCVQSITLKTLQKIAKVNLVLEFHRKSNR